MLRLFFPHYATTTQHNTSSLCCRFVRTKKQFAPSPTYLSVIPTRKWDDIKRDLERQKDTNTALRGKSVELCVFPSHFPRSGLSWTDSKRNREKEGKHHFSDRKEWSLSLSLSHREVFVQREKVGREEAFQNWLFPFPRNLKGKANQQRTQHTSSGPWKADLWGRVIHFRCSPHITGERTQDISHLPLWIHPSQEKRKKGKKSEMMQFYRSW